MYLPWKIKRTFELASNFNLKAGLRDDPAGGVTLTIPRDTERDIYATLAHREALRALRQLRRRGVPVGFVAGGRSEEIRLAGRDDPARRVAWVSACLRSSGNNWRRR